MTSKNFRDSIPSNLFRPSESAADAVVVTYAVGDIVFPMTRNALEVFGSNHVVITSAVLGRFMTYEANGLTYKGEQFIWRDFVLARRATRASLEAAYEFRFPAVDHILEEFPSEEVVDESAQCP